MPNAYNLGRRFPLEVAQAALAAQPVLEDQAATPEAVRAAALELLAAVLPRVSAYHRQEIERAE